MVPFDGCLYGLKIGLCEGAKFRSWIELYEDYRIINIYGLLIGNYCRKKETQLGIIRYRFRGNQMEL